MNAESELRSVRRLSTAGLFAAVGMSVVALPHAVLPLAWLLALALPAALLGLRRSPPRRPFLRALTATVLQLLACMLAYRLAGPITRPAALAGTILPPMMFVTVRRADVDATLGLFLSLCVLLVGTILGETPRWIIGAYLVAAVLQLRCEARLGALRKSQPPITSPISVGRRRRTGLPVASWLMLGVLSALVALAVDRSLEALPSIAQDVDESARPLTDGSNSRIGLPDSFILDGGGDLLELQGERLVELQSLDRDVIPETLYLRSGFFEQPSLESWSVGHLSHELVDSSNREWRLREPRSGTPIRRFEVTRTDAARDRVFTPPDTCTIYGLESLFVDVEREWFREPRPRPQGIYEVAFQQLPSPGLESRVEERWIGRGLTNIPARADHELLRQLLAEWRPTGTAMQKATTIADRLAERCSYLRREPSGPYGRALLDFLDGEERTGYCMHFASVAAIMLRMSDVPCRIGVGLYGGDPGDNETTRSYGSKHAHAWVEIPFEGRGWVVFDPTPPSERGRGDGNGSTRPTEKESTDADDSTTAGGILETFKGFVDWMLSTPWPWITLLAFLILQPHALKRKAAVKPLARAKRPARRWLLMILRALKERGIIRPRGTTLEQLADELRARDRLPADLNAALRAYQEVRFGGREWNDGIAERMQRGLAAAESLPDAGLTDAALADASLADAALATAAEQR